MKVRLKTRLKIPLEIQRYYPAFILILFLMTACVSSTGSSLPSNPTSSQVAPASGDSEITSARPTPTLSPTPSPSSIPNPKPSPSPSISPSPVSGLTGTAVLDAEELAFVILLNNYRTQNGVPKLLVSIALTQASNWMSHDMATKNNFDHTDTQGRDPFSRMDDFNYQYSSARGENIAAGNSSAQATFNQWKSSSAHNANMLSPNYTVIGLGRASDPDSDYTWYWTTSFGSKVDVTVP